MITYTRPGQDVSNEETLDPYHIFFKRRALYMEGYSITESGIRVYRMNRIGHVTLKTRGFAPKPNYDFGKRYKNAFSAFPGDQTEHVKIRFSKKVRPYIEESFWHQSQKLTKNKDGSLDFEVNVAYPREVMWWVFRWGAEAEVLEPEWLREEAQSEVERMMSIYQ
jgi:predicted DNA-binding transcriptional regulator YafY